MGELTNKKKCWRDKVTLRSPWLTSCKFAQEMGSEMSAAEVATFLNENGRAQSVWMHMMQAGERFIKSHLEAQPANLPDLRRSGVQVTMVQ
jgi:hypothetical protein